MNDLLQPVLESIGAWYLQHVPVIHATLRPGATGAELDALEQQTGLKLPEAFRALYKWHDGQDWGLVEVSGPGLTPLNPAEINRGGVFGLDFMPLEAVKESWENGASVGQDQGEWDEASSIESFPANAVQGAHITPGWLGFLEDGRRNYVGLDFAPGPAGTIGQVITFGRDETEHNVLADSLDEFLRDYEARLDDGLFIIGHPNGDGSWEVELLDLAGQGGSGIHGIASAFPDFSAVSDALHSSP